MLVDSHLDIAFNAHLGYDPRLPLAEARASVAGRRMAERGETPTVTLPSLRAAGTRVIFGTLFALPAGAPGDLAGNCYATPDEAHSIAVWQAEYYHMLHGEEEITLITSAADARAVAARSDEPDLPVGLVQLMEGADPIRRPGELRWWWERGVRILGPAWSATRYCGGTFAPGPLTALGRELIDEMNRVPLALDTSHLAEDSFWEALGRFDGPIIASHSNARHFVPTDRHLSDEMIRAIVDRDGVIGVVLYNRFLAPWWEPHHGTQHVTLETAVRHIEHICEIAGDTRHVGIGSDLDGGFGREGSPSEIDSCADLPQIGVALARAGWHQVDIDGVLGGNWLRWMERALP